MARWDRGTWWPRLGLLAAVALAASVSTASEQRRKTPHPGKLRPPHEVVELFAGMKTGQIQVKLIPKDSTRCRILIENKTKRPLSVQLPRAFAGVPVLAQWPLPADDQQQQNAPQEVGGGIPFFQGNQGNQNNGPFNVPLGRQNRGGRLPLGVAPENVGRGPFFNIAPERVGKLKLQTVCLEHGKPDPRPAMAYEIRPIESVAAKPAVGELCRMLGEGGVSQRAAQAAAWHLSNGMSWEKLKAERRKFVFEGRSEPFFTREELADAKKAATRATELAAARKPAGEHQSASLR